MTSATDIINRLKESIHSDTFVRFTLSKNQATDSTLKKVMIKLAVIKNKEHFSFVYRHKTKDITKNFLVKDGFLEISQLMESTFLIYNCFTTVVDLSGERDSKGQIKWKEQKPSFITVPSRTHDKTKKRLILETEYLKALDVLDASGRVKKDKGDKYKQINKFVEIIDGLVRKNSSLAKKTTLKTVDMGAGKGYLTFALYDYLTHQAKINTTVTGVEVRPDLIEKCNHVAKQVGFDQLNFELGFISDYDLPQTDILIALHACDTATDDAIFKGIKAGADLIVCAPCCHKQIRKEIDDKSTFQTILEHGILKERQAEIITDTIRALLMESQGYKTKVFEFISTEHTGKNLMIVGERHTGKIDQKKIFEKIKKLKTAFGVESHYLEGLL